jgi:hypothetical protein
MFYIGSLGRLLCLIHLAEHSQYKQHAHLTNYRIEKHKTFLIIVYLYLLVQL